MTHTQVEATLELLREQYKYVLEAEIWTCKRGRLLKIWTYSNTLFRNIVEVLGENKVILVTESFRGTPCVIITYRLDEES